MTHMEYEYTGMREERLDVVVANATGESRSKAQRLIKTGKVHVNGHPQTKPAYAVQPESTISVHMAMEDDYVSRGALKLLGAFNAFAPADSPRLKASIAWISVPPREDSAMCCCVGEPHR